MNLKRKTKQETKLVLSRVCRAKGTATSEIKRSLLEFYPERSRRVENIALVEEELVIEISRHNYTDTYKELTRDFYLKL
jgi:tRNA1Val (adenine37-N6)-methyltransferase